MEIESDPGSGGDDSEYEYDDFEPEAATYEPSLLKPGKRKGFGRAEAKAAVSAARQVLRYKPGTKKADSANRPLWVSPDGHIFLEAFSPIYQTAYDFLIAVAEPVSRPEMLHEYKLTRNSIFAASSIGLTAADIEHALKKLCKTEVPQSVFEKIRDVTSRYRQLAIVQREGKCFVEGPRRDLLQDLVRLLESGEPPKGIKRKGLADIIATPPDQPTIAERVEAAGGEGVGVGEASADGLTPLDIPMSDDEGEEVTKTVYYFEALPTAVDYIKQIAYTKYPILEEYEWRLDGQDPLPMALRPAVDLRPYQVKSLSKMFSNGRARSGLIVLPCGSGKTLVGVTAICTLRRPTVILCTSAVAVTQWKNQILMWSAGTRSDVADHVTTFTSGTKLPFSDRVGKETIDIDAEAAKPQYDIVISTFPMMIDRASRSEEGTIMMDIIRRKQWGMLVLDEVHVVASAEFRKCIATVAASCKLGLTATLVREDQRIAELYHLIGPKLYEANWLDLKRDGYIADVHCAEVWCPMTAVFYREYLGASATAVKRRYREFLYMMNPAKIRVCDYLVKYHEQRGDKILVFSDNIDALKQYAKMLGDKPYIYGKSSRQEREAKLRAFVEDNTQNTLFISKIGDNSIDLPDANVLIQISALYGSRRQEAQRLGRVSRPKVPGGVSHAIFYTLISTDTREKYFSTKRSRFLRDQGYAFKVITSLADKTAALPNALLTTDEAQEKFLIGLKSVELTAEEENVEVGDTAVKTKTKTRGMGKLVRGREREKRAR